MILVDTSVWIDHLRKTNSGLIDLLEQTQVVMHPWIIGEISLGNLKNRKEIISLLKALPSIEVIPDDEVLHLIETKKIMGKGIGWIDSQLLAAALIAGTPLWSTDKNLRALAASFGVLY